MLKLGENNLAKQSRLKRCVTFIMLNLYWVNIYYVADMNMFEVVWTQSPLVGRLFF
jgi:hypothetical protein